MRFELASSDNRTTVLPIELSSQLGTVCHSMKYFVHVTQRMILRVETMPILIDTERLVVARMFRLLKLNTTSILYLDDLIAQFSGVARPRPREAGH